MVARLRWREHRRAIRRRWPDLRNDCREEPVFLLASGWRTGSTLVQRLIVRSCFTWGEPFGHALSYQAVNGIVERLRARTGIFFTPHMMRHTHASDLIRRGVPIEVVSKRLTHQSVTTTSDIYVHLSAEDVRGQLEKAGVWTQEEAQ